MAHFQTKADLSSKDAAELARILAIASAQRTSVEADFLTARADYELNEILLTNEAGEIVLACGVSLPTGLTGFMKGAEFILLDATDGSHARYENTGDADASTWEGHAMVDVSADAPVNAVNSFQTLTVSAITSGVHAESVITSDTTNVTADEVVVIGTRTYRFKDTMAAAYDVKIGASAAATLDNLAAAINASGTAGVEYYTGTLAHPTVRATTNTDTTQKVVSRTQGTTNNALATTTTASHLAWEDTTLGGGTGVSVAGVAGQTVTVGTRTYTFVSALSETSGAAAVADQVLYGGSVAIALDNLKLAINAGDTAGTEYSTGTTAHAIVTATTNTNSTQVVEVIVAGTSGDGLGTTETVTGSWGSTVTAGGVDGTEADEGDQITTASYIYTAIDDNGVADKNWRRVSLGSAF